MVVFLKKILLTLTLTFMSAWIIHYGIYWSIANNRKDTFEGDPLKNVRYFPDVFYDTGIKAWYKNDHDSAIVFFRNALSVNRLHMDAWLGMAQAKMAVGNEKQAAEILRFSHHLTQGVVKWKWMQLILAWELNIEDIFQQNINHIISYPRFQNEAFALMDLYFNSDTDAILRVLENRHYSFYLNWLMRWGRTGNCAKVWTVMADKNIVDDYLYERYLHFLVSQREIRRASETRKIYTGESGMTNPGFESPLSNRAFGWREQSGKNWSIKRVSTEKIQGDYALQVVFSGEENINFRHLRQIVPVLSGKDYKMYFWWRSHDLTTDQRPFFEIRGFDCKGYWKSQMAPANTDWRREHIYFSVPEDCSAVTVRLRRNISNRFDNKIRGTLWLDDFNLESYILESYIMENR